jgi:hypothetical protein
MHWVEAAGRLRAAIYAPLWPAIARLPVDRWPGNADLNALAGAVHNSGGMPIRFVAPRDAARGQRPHYETRVAATGEVETRAESWHDLFNALVWITFPRSKAAINAQHAAILEAGGEAEARHRSPARDALTLFDEGGVIVVSTSPEMHRLVVDFRWKELFWAQRAELSATTRFFAFGHACYEQALAPYIGMVAKTVLVEVARGIPVRGAGTPGRACRCPGRTPLLRSRQFRFAQGPAPDAYPRRPGVARRQRASSLLR